jgi:nucleoside-diphosphate-sugar epimerase
MRVLLTGSDGYLGAVVGPMLATAGHEVVGLDTGYFADCHHGPAPATAAKPVDLRDLDASVCDGLDSVVHLGALSNDPLGNLDAALTHAINTEATLHLARVARDAGVARFVFSSSCSIYGASGGDDIMDENAPMRPVTPYAESKVRVEEGLHELADDSFTPISLRNATAYGWSPRLRLDLVLNDLVASALLTGEVRVLSDGTPWRPIVHARDIGGAFCAALGAPIDVVHNRAFNVGFTAENYQVRDLAEIVAEVLEGSRVLITGETGPDPRSYRVDFSRAAAAFPDWTQEWDARRGARDLVDRFAEFGLVAEDRVRFSRVAWLTALRKAGRLSPTLRWERSGVG